MIIKRQALATTSEYYQLDFNEELVEQTNRHIRLLALNPDDLPNISLQTLVQCFMCKPPKALKNYTFKSIYHTDERPDYMYLYLEIRRYLDRLMWDNLMYTEEEGYTDIYDEPENSDTYAALLHDPNPDFSSSKDEATPEGLNDLF